VFFQNTARTNGHGDDGARSIVVSFAMIPEGISIQDWQVDPTNAKLLQSFRLIFKLLSADCLTFVVEELALEGACLWIPLKLPVPPAPSKAPDADTLPWSRALDENCLIASNIDILRINHTHLLSRTKADARELRS